MIAKLFFAIFCIGFAKSQELEAMASSGFGLNRFPGEDCFRSCKDTTPKPCYFKWTLEHYTAMGLACGTCGKPGGLDKDCFNEQCVTVDGVPRGVMTINRQIPGPSIHVCKGDLIVVDVVNMMGGTAASIHWHGFHQRKTPHFDGVPFVTQCPIDYATTFRYAFWASEPGTQFYHSHSGHHKVNGQYGGIVVRENPKDDPNSKLYNTDAKENLIVLSDWMNDYGEAMDPGVPLHPFGQVAKNFLINGKGQYTDKTTRTTTRTPLAYFKVAGNKTHRFRLVNSMSLVCPAELTIESHVLTVIASDSFNLQPVDVTSIVSLPGERYDFVINANQPGETFWIRVKALGVCASREIQQFAVLNYKPTDDNKMKLSFPTRLPTPYFLDTFPDDRSINHPNTKCGLTNPKSFCITDLSSHVFAPDVTDAPTVDHKFYLGFHNYPVNVSDAYVKGKYEHYSNPAGSSLTVGGINNISLALPPVSLLTQTNDIDESIFCDEFSRPARCNGIKICHCVHRLKVKLNSTVELVILDETGNAGAVNHPFHLHGFPLFVMGMGLLDDNPSIEKLRKLDQQGRLSRAIGKIFPIKDTIAIPSKGYTIFRFRANNPGFWLLHCHFEFHLATGMGLILQVGEYDQMVKPPTGFPKCNNFVPDVDESIFDS